MITLHLNLGVRSFFGILVLVILLWPAGSAQALQGIGVSPTSQQVSLAPGGAKTGTFTVINDGGNDITYRLYAADYSVKGEDYRGLFETSNANISAVSWFKLPTTRFTIKAHDQINVTYTVTAPKAAAVGGHYAAIFIETIPPPNPGGTRIARIDRIASLFFLAIEGDLQRKGTVLPFDVPWLQSTPPVNAALRFRNDGNVHYTAEGTVELATPFGRVGKPVPFKGEILPSTTRRLAVQLPSQSPIGLYKVTAKVNYLDKTQELSHWTLLMPRITFLIASGTLLLLLVVGLWRLMRRARRR